MTYLHRAYSDLSAAVSNLYNRRKAEKMTNFLYQYGIQAAATIYAAYQLYQNPMKFDNSTRILCAIGLSGIANDFIEAIKCTKRFAPAISNTTTCLTTIGNALCAIYMPQYYCAEAAVFTYYVAYSISNEMGRTKQSFPSSLERFLRMLQYNAGLALLNCAVVGKMPDTIVNAIIISPNVIAYIGVEIYAVCAKFAFDCMRKQ